MKNVFTLCVIALFSTATLFGQMKPDVENRSLQGDRNYTLEELSESMVPFSVQTTAIPGRTLQHFNPQTIPILLHPGQQDFSKWQVKNDPRTGRPYWIEATRATPSVQNPEEQITSWLNSFKPLLGIETVDEYTIQNQKTDELGQLRVSLQQTWQGVPIYGGEWLAHFKNNELFLMNGCSYPSPSLENVVPAIPQATAVILGKEAVAKHSHFKELSDWENDMILGEAVEAKLVIFHLDRNPSQPKLAWEVTLTPHLGERWQLMIDAQNGAVLREFDHVCHFMPPPPQVTNSTDLQGQSREIHSYRTGNVNYLIDASRNMHDAANSTFPDDGQGVIWTINGNNTSPANSNFQATHVTSSGNFWNDPLTVSAHYNAGEAYRYFETTHNRNSINGQGGTIISIINVSDDDGTDMDNAFWNGAAMFYGNGNQSFTSPLAKALDVAGHELSHGVVQNTANLEYMGEAGAMNESFADIFGAMIDRDDWQMGEEVVNSNHFPSGALRDLSNPHNGGNNLNDPGWQPAHTNEQYFGSQDNGGVHINSGITNKAFFLLATNIGKEKSEKIFYRALNNYLTRSSQFIDLRQSAEQSALDLYGQSESNSVATAFSSVGIGSSSTTGSGGTPTTSVDDLSPNPGNEYVLFADGNLNELLIETPNGGVIANPLTTLSPLSKPTITDDGSAVVYVATDKTLRAIIINWTDGSTQLITLSSQAIWRNAAVSRDGNRVAALTDSYTNEIIVFDFETTGVPNQSFELYNPTFTEGVSTGNVEFADVLEWDHSGQFVLYDALNVIPSQFGTDIEYWDIGFVHVWNNGSSSFGSGDVTKIFSSLPDNTSVGNPTLSKNSPYIVAFDFIDNNDNTNFLLAANTETGAVGELFENSMLSYPNYSNLDDRVIFDAMSNGARVVADIDVNNDKITPASDAFVFIDNGFNEARWGVWFANGIRNLVEAQDLFFAENWIKVYPTVFDRNISVELLTPPTEDIEVVLYNTNGQQLWQHQMDKFQSSESLQLPELPAGAYVLFFSDGKNGWAQRIVKK